MTSEVLSDADAGGLAGRVEDEDERVDCYAGDWNEFRIEPGDDIGSDEEDCIFE